MTVFKGYMKLTWKNISYVLMYFGIFLVIAIVINMASQREKEGYAARKLNVAVVDLDGSGLSGQLIRYLKERHYVTMERDDKAKLSEELYYQGKDVVLYIQKGFEKKAQLGETGINITNSPGSYNGIYLEQQINNFLRNATAYHAAGYGVEESCGKVIEQKEANVTMEDLNGNGGEMPAHGGFFQYLPYLFLCVFGVVLGKILSAFRERRVKNRLMASSVSLGRQNAETILAFTIIGSAMYLACIVCVLALYHDSVMAAKNFVWYLVNGFLLMIVSLEIAFLIGILIKKEQQANIVTTPLSLGICFLCGVFVPLEVMGEQVKTVAKFLPMYWYEAVNNLLMEYENISGVVGRQVLAGMGIQVLFIIALAGVGMSVVKYKQQER